MSKKGIIFLVAALLGLGFIVYNYSQQANRALGTGSSSSAPLSTSGQETKDIFEQSIEASNNKDIQTYTTLLVPKAKANTEKELSKFFKSYDVRNSLQSYRVLDDNGDHLLAEAKVKSINLNGDQKQYRDNLATLDVSFVRQNGKWLIELTTTVDTQILKN